MQYFKFDLLDKPRKLRYDMLAMADLEDAMGKGFFPMLREDAGFKFAMHLVWAGLKWQDDDLTPRDVGKLIQKHVIDEGKGSVLTVIRAAMRAVTRSGVLQALGKSNEEAKAAVEALDLDLKLEDDDLDIGGHRPPELPAGEKPRVVGSGKTEKAKSPVAS